MAAASKKKKELALKPKHKRTLKNLSKLFHGLGINIGDHIETFELEEEELDEIRKTYGTSAFLGPRDRTMFREIISNLLSVMKALVVLEELLWKQVIPYVHTAAQKKEESPDLIALGALRELHTRTYQKGAVNLKSALAQVRKYLLGSFAHEHELIFKKYQRLLRAIEANLEDLAEIEARQEKVSHMLRGDLLKQLAFIRHIFYEDAYYLTKDIARLYDIRVETYKWLIEADKAVSPRMFPMLESEFADVLAVRNYYVDSYKTHLKNLAELYAGGEEK